MRPFGPVPVAIGVVPEAFACSEAVTLAKVNAAPSCVGGVVVVGFLVSVGFVVVVVAIVDGPVPFVEVVPVVEAIVLVIVPERAAAAVVEGRGCPLVDKSATSSKNRRGLVIGVPVEERVLGLGSVMILV